MPIIFMTQISWSHLRLESAAGGRLRFLRPDAAMPGMRWLAGRQDGCVSRRGLGQWRWMAVAALIAVLVSSVALFLRTEGLSGAANFTQLLTPISFILPAVNWARSKKSGEQHRAPEGQSAAPGREAAVVPNAEALDPAGTPRPRSGASPGQPLIPHAREAPAKASGANNTPSLKPKGRRRWAAWSIPVLAVAALIAVEAGLQAGNSDGSAHTVPDVDNLPVGKAVSLLRAQGLIPDVVGFSFCLTQLTPAGLVMQAMPPSGGGISKGATVELYVCTGMGLPVPQVTGLPLGNAIQQLGEYGFRYTIHYSSAPPAEGIPTGVVWKQSPQAQSTYTFGDAVTLWVASQASASPVPKTTRR